MLSGRRAGDGGFTLPELLISITILGVIMGSIAFIFLGILNVNQDTSQRLDATRVEQFAALDFAADVQGMKAAGGLVTSGAADCGTGAFVAEFRGETYDPSAVMTARRRVATYSLEDATLDGQPVKRLRRSVCEAAIGASSPLTPVSSELVVGVLADVVPAAPTVSGTNVTWTLTRIDGSTFSLVGVRRTS